MTPEQRYIFPTAGVTQDGDEIFMPQARSWMRCGPGDDITLKAWPVRRPVAPQPLQWIAYSERKPTEADVDDAGDVRVLHNDTIFFTNWKNVHPLAYWHGLPKRSAIPKPDTCRAEFEAWWAENRSPAFKENSAVKAHCLAAWQSAKKEAPTP